jgi:hypothetical protein
MPPRWLAAAIVAVWLTSSGWLFWGEFWPYLRPGEPPAFSYDLKDEAQTENPHVRWKVFRGDEQVYQVLTSVHYYESTDSFDFKAELTPHRAPLVSRNPLGDLEKMESHYKVNRDGSLRGVNVTAKIEPNPKLTGFLPSADNKPFFFEFRFVGEVRDGQFTLTVEAAPGLKREFPPVAVSRNGAIMLLQHPVNRIRGLRPGQTWAVPLIDPLGAVLMGRPPHYFHARVLDQTEDVQFEAKPHTCYVIDYHDDDQSMKAWVETSEQNRLLVQEAHIDGERWRLERDAASSAVR